MYVAFLVKLSYFEYLGLFFNVRNSILLVRLISYRSQSALALPHYSSHFHMHLY